ncbi:JAB domain-containing protein [Acinetobacter soli]
MDFHVQLLWDSLYLNTKNQLIARKTLFVGGLNSSIVHPRDVFREALKLSAACFITVHNPTTL